MTKRESLLKNLSPEQIKMLLWWADETMRIESRSQLADRPYKDRFTVEIIAKELGVTTQAIDSVFRYGKSKRIEERILEIINPYMNLVNSKILKLKYIKYRKSNGLHVK